MAINRKQGRVIAAGGLVAIAMLLFPPWCLVRTSYRPGARVVVERQPLRTDLPSNWLGYAFLANPPVVAATDHAQVEVEVDIVRLVIQFLALAVATALAVFVLRSPG